MIDEDELPAAPDDTKIVMGRIRFHGLRTQLELRY